MKLRAYLDSLPRGGVTALANQLGRSPIYVSQLAAEQDGREPSAELSVAFEVATDRQVMRWDLRPADWHRIWPELVGIDGAPQPVEVKAGA